MTINAQGYQARAIAVPRLRTGQMAAFRQALLVELAADRAIYILAGLYIAATTCLAIWLGGEHKLVLFMYRIVWPVGVANFALIYLLVRKLPGAVRDAPDRPLREFGRRIAEVITPRVVAGACLIATQSVIMGTFTSVKNLLTDMTGYVWDRRLADIDAFLHGGVDAWHWLSPIVTHPWAVSVVEHGYLTAWMAMVVGIPAVVAVSPSLSHMRVRMFITYILCWIVVGNVLAGLFMSAGPAFFGEVTGDFDRFRVLIDHLAANTGSAYSAFDLQRDLWYVYSHDQVALGTGISAFPSMHVAMATLWVIVGFQVNRRLGAIALGLLLFFLTGSVVLGWHYAIDGYASILIVLALWAIVGWAMRAWPGPVRQTLTPPA